MRRTPARHWRRIDERFGDRQSACRVVLIRRADLEVEPDDLIEVRDRAARRRSASVSSMLIDLCGVDYLSYGSDEWKTEPAGRTSRGFQCAASGAERVILDGADEFDARAFRRRLPPAVRYANNVRLRLRVFCRRTTRRSCRRWSTIWNGANWFEREAFDLYGILFEGHPGPAPHPDRLRLHRPSVPQGLPADRATSRCATTRKGRVVYEPVSIEPRTLVPRVIRDDNRYSRRPQGPNDG